MSYFRFCSRPILASDLWTLVRFLVEILESCLTEDIQKKMPWVFFYFYFFKGGLILYYNKTLIFPITWKCQTVVLMSAGQCWVSWEKREISGKFWRSIECIKACELSVNGSVCHMIWLTGRYLEGMAITPSTSNTIHFHKSTLHSESWRISRNVPQETSLLMRFMIVHILLTVTHYAIQYSSCLR